MKMSQEAQEVTVTVETEPAPESTAAPESTERTVGRLEAETEHLAETVEEATETAETAEAKAETAQAAAFATMDQIAEIRGELSDLREQIAELSAELDESEDGQESEVQEVEIPVVIEQPEPAPENRGILKQILFG